MDKTNTHGTITHAVEIAERFFEGFEDDESQEGIGESVALIRKAKATLEVLVGVSIDDLKTRIAVDLALLRLLADEPVTVDYSRSFSWRFAPLPTATGSTCAIGSWVGLACDTAKKACRWQCSTKGAIPRRSASLHLISLSLPSPTEVLN